MGSIPTVLRTVPQSFPHLPWVPFLPVGLLWCEHGSPPSTLAKLWLSPCNQSWHHCREENSTSGEETRTLLQEGAGGEGQPPSPEEPWAGPEQG